MTTKPLLACFLFGSVRCLVVRLVVFLLDFFKNSISKCKWLSSNFLSCARVHLSLKLKRFGDLSEFLWMRCKKDLFGSLAELGDLDLESCPLNRIAQLFQVDTSLVSHRMEYIVGLE